MKVPLYDAQVRPAAGGAGRRLTVQVSPQAAAAPGRALADFGEAIFEMGYERAKLQSEAQAKEASAAMEVELQAIKDAADKLPATEENQDDTLRKMRGIYQKYRSGDAINPVTGKKFMRSEAARNLFAPAGQQTLSAYQIDYRKSSNEKIVELGKANAELDLAKNVSLAADATRTDADRQSTLDGIFSSDMVPGPDGVMRPRGSIFFNFQRGLIDASEIPAIVQTAAEDLVVGSATTLMQQTDDPLAVARAIADGTIDDPVITAAMAQLDPSSRQTLMKQTIEMAKKLDADNERLEKEREDQVEAVNQAAYLQILNVDVNDESSLNQARAKHELLLKANFYESRDKRKAAEAILGIDDLAGSSATESSPDALVALSRLDADQMLTVDSVVSFQDQLSKSDFSGFLSRAVGEVRDGVSNAQSIISSSVRFNEFKDGVGDLDKAASQLHAEAQLEFQRWLQTDRINNDPMSGGRGASYEELQRKAFAIGETFQARLLPVIQSAFDSYVIGLEVLRPSIESATGQPLVIDPNNRVGSIEAYLSSIPASVVAQNISIRTQIEKLVPFLTETGIR